MARRIRHMEALFRLCTAQRRPITRLSATQGYLSNCSGVRDRTHGGARLASRLLALTWALLLR
eukprot:903809-Prorocentrum_minimum.AAC.1